MNSFILPLLQAQDGQPQGQGLTSTILMFGAIIAIFYFFMIRPQSKKRKETEKMLSALKKGDKIVTIGGLHGIIQSVKESTVIIKVDDNVKLEFLRSAVSNVVQVSREREEKVEDNSEDKEKTEEQSSESGA